jgi:hypothetical protein
MTPRTHQAAHKSPLATGCGGRAQRTLALFTSTVLCVLLAACKARSADGNGETTSSPVVTRALQVVQPDIRVAYPPNGTLIPASSTYVAGACPAGKQVECNGDSVKTNAKG